MSDDFAEWDRHEADRLGEMHTVWAPQYQKPCVVVFPSDTAQQIIDHCRAVGAIYREDGPEDECFVVVLRHDIGPELYTEEAVRRSAHARLAQEGGAAS